MDDAVDRAPIELPVIRARSKRQVRTNGEMTFHSASLTLEVNMMASFFKNGVRRRIIFALVGILLAGCSMDENKKHVSEDIVTLKTIILLPAGTRSVRWELFGTPETTGGVPGPTDYLTLVAELNSDETFWTALPKHAPTDVYIVAEAARPWLSNDFRQLMNKNRNANFTVSKNNDCRSYGTRLTKTGKQVEGLICKGVDRFLLYVTVLSRG
jgi:hypothetical protein